MSCTPKEGNRHRGHNSQLCKGASKRLFLLSTDFLDSPGNNHGQVFYRVYAVFETRRSAAVIGRRGYRQQQHIAATLVPLNSRGRCFPQSCWNSCYIAIPIPLVNFPQDTVSGLLLSILITGCMTKVKITSIECSPLLHPIRRCLPRKYHLETPVQQKSFNLVGSDTPPDPVRRLQ